MKTDKIIIWLLFVGVLTLQQVASNGNILLQLALQIPTTIGFVYGIS